MTRLRLACASFAIALLPSVAEACPSCARGKAGPGIVIAIGSMILLPFAITAIVLPVFRRGGAAKG